MKTEEQIDKKEQQEFVDKYNKQHGTDYNREAWSEIRQKKNESDYQELGYPLQDLKNPIDGGSKVEWAYWNTKLYPLQMHDKLTNKNFFMKKGIPEKNFPKRYYLSNMFNFQDVIQKLHEKNNINSLVIKPSMMAESKGIMKINKIVPYKKSEKTTRNKNMFKQANPDIMDLIKDKGAEARSRACRSNRPPFKGTYSRSIIYEENLNPNKDGFLDDYKFWCVNGEPIFCEVISGRANGEINVAFIDKNKQRLPLNHTQQRNMTKQELKNVLKECSDKSYKEMLDMAKKASNNIPLIRIDFCLNSKGEPKLIEAQDLYNYHMHRITMDDITREGERNKCSGRYTPPTFEPNTKNVEIMARKFKLDPKAFTKENCKIYNNATGKIEQISSFEKLIGNLIDLTKIDEKDIGDYPCGDPEEAKKKEEEAKQYLRKMKKLNKMSNIINKNTRKIIKQAFNELKTPHRKWLEKKNKQQKEEKEKLKQIRKNIKPYIPVDSKRFLQVPNPYVGGNRIKFQDTKHKNYSFLPDLKHNLIGGKKKVFNLNYQNNTGKVK